MITRTATVNRHTKETEIAVTVNLDGGGESDIHTGIPFFDHMLEQLARHGLLDLAIRAAGDLEVDAHHTVEDVGITFGQALREAWGEKRGIRRYGHAYVPLDEALSRVVIDCSGRPGLTFQVDFPRARVAEFDVDLVYEFFQGLVNHALITVHVDTMRGRNAHHVIESIFKAFAKALRMACEPDPRSSTIVPSTKGTL